MAFSQLEPFGFNASMYGHAITSSIIANVNRRKNSKPFKPEDFMPQEKEIESKSLSFMDSLKMYFGVRNNGK